MPHHLSWCLAILIGWMLLIGSACAPPQDALTPLGKAGDPPTITERITDKKGDSSSKKTSKEKTSTGQTSSKGTEKEQASGAQSGEQAQSKGAEGKDTTSDADKDLGKELASSVDVDRVTSQLQKAERALVRNFKGFLERRSLGFGTDLVPMLLDDLEGGVALVQRAQTRIAMASPLELTRNLAPLVVVSLFVVLLTLLDRQFTSMAHGFQASRYPRVSLIVTLTLRGFILIIGQLSGPLLLVGLSYFPVRAIFGEVPWSVLLTKTLWILTTSRLGTSLIEIGLGLPFLRLSDDHAQRLHSTVTRAIQIVAILVLLLEATRALVLQPEYIALGWFTFQLTVGLLPLILLRLRPSVMALLQEQTSTSLYAVLLRSLARKYYWLLSLTIILLVMRAFGYVHASNFLLARGYGLLGASLLLFFGLAQIRDTFADRLEDLEEDDPQFDLIESIRRLLSVAIVVIGVLVGLRILALYEPVLLLLKTPLLIIQSVKFSIFNVLSAVLIVGAATLASKIVRAILNAKVYPSVGVEVGVAYAINTIISYAIVVIGFFLVLIALGVNLSALTVVLASLSVGIGFGLQTLTENLISGFIILFGRSVRKGDYITVNDIYGRVEAVGARSVVVRTVDNYDLLIPSKDLVGGTIINWTYRDSIVRAHIPVGVTYSAEPRVVERVLNEAAEKHDNILAQPAPEVWFVGFGDSAINFELLVYYDCRQTMAERLKGELYYHIWDALEQEGIEIPFPQRDLHVRSAEMLPQLEEMLSRQRGANNNGNGNGATDQRHSGSGDSDASDDGASDED